MTFNFTKRLFSKYWLYTSFRVFTSDGQAKTSAERKLVKSSRLFKAKVLSYDLIQIDSLIQVKFMVREIFNFQLFGFGVNLGKENEDF